VNHFRDLLAAFLATLTQKKAALVSAAFFV
jgi:hypothetical protein